MKALWLLLIIIPLYAGSDDETESKSSEENAITTYGRSREGTITETHKHFAVGKMSYDAATCVVNVVNMEEKNLPDIPPRSDSRLSASIKYIQQRKMKVALIGLASTTITATSALLYALINCETKK